MVLITEILKYLDIKGIKYEYHGDETVILNGFSQLSELSSDSITWIKKIDIFSFPANVPPGVVFVINYPLVSPPSDFNYIYCDNPKSTFFSILNHFWKKITPPSISKDSIVETKSLGKNVSIGHYSYVGKDVVLEDDVIINNHVSIEGKVVIGEGSIIYSGAVLGSDGYGLYVDRDGLNQKIPHYGGIIIGKNVEIGANTCIDRGTLGDTIIGDNVKIHNLCQIAHNVCIEKNSCIVSGVLISGSVHIAENSYVAPGAIIMNQVHVGKDALVGMGAVVTKNVEENTVVVGVPAKPLRKNKGE